jgi:DnaD/phage-associated family protein
MWSRMGNYSFTIHKTAGVTPVPNIFIEEYMPSADGNFVKVYLAGLLEALAPGNVHGFSLSDKLGLIDSDIIKAWEYWESKGLVKFTRSGNSEMSVEFLGISGIYTSRSMPEPGYEYSSENILRKMENPMVRDMFESMEKLLGRTLSSKEFSMYLSWLDDYSFSPEVVILLIEYCKSKGKVDSRYIEKVAIGWHDANVSSIEDAQRYIAQHEGKYNKYRLVLDFLGLKENDLMKPQQEFLDKWFDTWGFSLEMVLEACKICSLRINEPKFSYIDGILSNWHKKGAKEIKDIESVDSKNKNKNVKFKAPVNSFNSYDQRTYDIKELEKKLLGRDEEVEDAK